MDYWISIKDWWKNYGSRLILAISFLLVAVLSFEAGLLQRSLSQESAPVIIRVTEPAILPEKTPSVDEKKSPSVDAGSGEVHCQLVGSRNSNKYHHPESRCAKQIKATNKVCFTSVDDAKAKGYLPGCLAP